jgi:hypothetical protein
MISSLCLFFKFLLVCISLQERFIVTFPDVFIMYLT